jgi:hypothetical protein
VSLSILLIEEIVLIVLFNKDFNSLDILLDESLILFITILLSSDTELSDKIVLNKYTINPTTINVTPI